MSKALLQRLDKALATIPSITEAPVEYGAQFGQTREGRTLEDLRWVVGPLSDNPRRVTIGAGGRREDAGPAERWTMDELWAAIAPMVKRMARQMSSGGFSRSRQQDPHAFDDLVQNAAFAVLRAIERGDDEGRIGNSFTTWIRGRIRSAIRNGIMGGPEYRNSRGFLGQLIDTKNIEQVRAVAERIPEQYRTEGEFARDNPFGQYSPMLFSHATNLINAFQVGDATAIRRAKQEIDDTREEVRQEEEQASMMGATTGLHDAISLSHSGDTRDKFRQQHKQVGTEIQGEGGEMIERPGMPTSGPPDEPDSSQVNKAIVRKALVVARKGYNGPEGKIQPLDTRSYQILIRLFGFADYPDRGTETDPEWDPNKVEEILNHFQTTATNEPSQDPESGEEIPPSPFGHISVKPVNVFDAARLAEMSGFSREDMQEVVRAVVNHERGMTDDEVELDLFPDNAQQAQQIANHLAFSNWVRAGCPELTPAEINKNSPLGLNLNVSSVRINQLIDRVGKMTGPGKGKNPKVGVLRQIGNLIGAKLQQAAEEEETGKVVPAESADPVAHALYSLWEVLDFHRNQIALTEDVNSIGYKLLALTTYGVQRKLTNYLESLISA